MLKKCVFFLHFKLHRRIIRAAESAECRELKVRFEDAVKDGDAFLEKTFKENFNSKCKVIILAISK